MSPGTQSGCEQFINEGDTSTDRCWENRQMLHSRADTMLPIQSNGILFIKASKDTPTTSNISAAGSLLNHLVDLPPQQ